MIVRDFDQIDFPLQSIDAVYKNFVPDFTILFPDENQPGSVRYAHSHLYRPGIWSGSSCA